MKIKSIALLSVLTLFILNTPVFSQTQEIDISKIPTINNKDWRTPSSFSPPWSTPVLVNDEFEGTYLAVFDHNFQKPWGSTEENGITSSWSPKIIRTYAYTTTSGGTTIKETSGLIVKVGGKAYPLTGKKGNFNVTPELAYALKTAPLEVAKIKVEFEDSGVPLVSDIGTGTVTAWRTVYQQAKSPREASIEQPKVNQPVSDSVNPPTAVPKKTPKPKLRKG
jgi:hypothetical protein